MRKPRAAAFILFLTLFVSCNSKNKPRAVLTTIKELDSYPSASGIEFLNDKIYVIGDDANNLLVLDTNLNIIDSIVLYHYSEKRIPKSIKADLESIAILNDGRLLITGSGSLSPFRDTMWMIDPLTQQKDSHNLDTMFGSFYPDHNIKERNIEGATIIPGAIVLANRGSKGYPKNHLLYAQDHIGIGQTDGIGASEVLYGNDTSHFNGVSGLDFVTTTNQLLLTVSTEDTRNALDDGTIGKSYLWIINNYSSRFKQKTLSPDRIIDLEQVDAHFKGHKIESVCVLKETDDLLYLLLAADNDNGSSTLFKLVVPKE